MKVLMCVHTGDDGLFIYAKELSESLSHQGCTVYLLTTYDCPHESGDINILRYLQTAHERSGNMWNRLSWAAKSLRRVLHNSRKRTEVCRFLRPDIVHLQLTKPIVDQFYVAALSKEFNTVLTVHDVRHHQSGNINNRKSFLRRLFHSVHLLIVHAAANKRQLMEEFSVPPERIVAIPHGVSSFRGNFCSREEARQALGLQQESSMVLFFGNIRENKGLDILLDAMHFVVMRHPSARLLIAGRIDHRESLKRYESLLTGLGLQNHVILRVGWIEDDIMEKYFLAADIVALPYKSFASQSGVLLQAYKYGKPVVVTDVGGLGETVSEDKTGLVVEAVPEAICSGILQLLEGKHLYEESSLNMRAALDNKYQWDKVAYQTRGVYETLLRTRGL